MSKLFAQLLFSFSILAEAQAQTIFLGAGNNDAIRVTSSSEQTKEYWKEVASAENTINGRGLDMKLMQASRFLAQATLGANLLAIEEVAAIGMENWIENQYTVDATSMSDKLASTYEERNQWFLDHGGDTSEIGGRPSWIYFNYAWWDANLKNKDLLRQRIAFALSEIFVISIRSELEGYGDGLASYYDIFSNHAFGNYRDILREVALHPCMGFYLSHLNNPKSVPEENVHPDENFAREAMQLFSIGLYELNPDGTRKKDSLDQDVPTYGQAEIKEFAKIWTGLGIADVIPNMYEEAPYFGMGIYSGNVTVPMVMYEEYHEPSEKQLLNGVVVPAGQSGMDDVEDAIDNLFSHNNVGPFITRRLIQRLVKSNPSPQYVARVTAAFNGDGANIRGDMKAIIKAILLDQEARECEWINDESQGKLREPFVRYTHFVRANQVEQYYNRYWNSGYKFWEETGQSVFGAPSVFNFFLPDHQPVGSIADAGLVGPEFQIHNSRTSVGFINHVNSWSVYNNVMNSWEENDPNTFLNTDDLHDLARDPEVLVNRLDILFTHGALSDRTRSIINEAIEALIYGDYRQDRVELAMYLLLISPDYAILR